MYVWIAKGFGGLNNWSDTREVKTEEFGAGEGGLEIVGLDQREQYNITIVYWQKISPSATRYGISLLLLAACCCVCDFAQGIVSQPATHLSINTVTSSCLQLLLQAATVTSVTSPAVLAD